MLTSYLKKKKKQIRFIYKHCICAPNNLSNTKYSQITIHKFAIKGQILMKMNKAGAVALKFSFFFITVIYYLNFAPDSKLFPNVSNSFAIFSARKFLYIVSEYFISNLIIIYS